MAAATEFKSLKDRLSTIVEAPWFVNTVMTLIFINAITFGLETYPALMAEHGPLLLAIDQLILWIFVAELSLRLVAAGPKFFRDPWALFDTTIVALAFLPSSGALSVLRVARVFRALRVISVFPRLRQVVRGLLTAIPGIASIGAILVTVLYVFSVIATQLFGSTHGEWFGTLHASLFTLFQVMTLEGWPDIVRDVLQVHPWAWMFFISYILIVTFTVLNLFIAVVVDAMTKEADPDFAALAAQRDLAAIRAELELLSRKLDGLRPTA